MSRTSVTLRDLAEALDLSTATISRALNGFPEVNIQTRSRVQTAAKQMGYHPNASARRLANGLVGAIGLVPFREDNEFIEPLIADFLDGVTSVFAENGVELSLLASVGEDTRAPFQRAIAGKIVDAFIVTSPSIKDPRVDELIRKGFPFVLHGRTEASAPHWSYDIDNYGGFHCATRLLIEKGHSNIAFLGGRPDARFTVDRLEGTRDALAAKGLALPEQNIRFGSMSEDLGHHSGSQFLQLPRGQRPTAFLCLNIFVAMGLLRAARELGLSCPQDLSIIVHDDRAPYIRAEFSDPPLTALQSSIRVAGQRVSEMALEAVANPDTPPRQIVEPVELIVRNSVGCLPG